MAKICPNCQSILTPSVVGYLCDGCGSVHHFAKTSTDSPRSELNILPTEEHDSSTLPGQPHHEKIGHFTSTPPALDMADDGIPLQPALNSMSERKQRPLGKSPRLSLEDARSFRKRLRHRLKQMIVPELPAPPQKTALTNDEGVLPAPKSKTAAAFDDTPPPPARPTPADRISPASKSAIPNTKFESTALKETVAGLPNPTTPKPKRHLVLIVSSIGIILGTLLAIMIVSLINRHNSQSVATPATTTTPVQKPLASASPSAAPSVNTAAQARDAQRKKDLKDIATALEVYRKANGSYPTGSDINVLYPLQYTTPPYITYINYDPSTTDGNNIKYGYSSNGTGFTLTAQLENPNDPEAKNGLYSVTNTP